MDVVIISHFCGDFSKSDNDRFLYIANMLCKEHDVELITSDFFHTTKKHRNKPASEWSFITTFIHEPGYPKNVCIKRFASHYVWGKNVETYIKTRKKPDVIYCAVPSLTGPGLIAKYCEKNHIRFIIDVQDLWPEAFRMAVNIPVISDVAFLPFQMMANGIYKRADVICAVSDTYCRRAKAVNKKCKETTTVYLGTDLEAFDRYALENSSIQKKSDEVWLAYVGTLGSSYDLPIVFEAMRQLNNPKLRFIIMGDGPLKDRFEEESRDLNVLFMGRIPYEKVCGILAHCDMVANPIVSKSVATIINKHADYAACGKPVLNTQQSREYRKLIHDYHMGINCNNAQELATVIDKLCTNRVLRDSMGKNARLCAEELFDRKDSYTQLSNLSTRGG